jgi:hypothetical protein
MRLCTLALLACLAPSLALAQEVRSPPGITPNTDAALKSLAVSGNFTANAGVFSRSITQTNGSQGNQTGDTKLTRSTNHTGGSYTDHSQALYVESTANSGPLNSEWAALIKLNNYNIGGANGQIQNVGLVTAAKNFDPSGWTWAQNMITTDGINSVDGQGNFVAGVPGTGHIVGLEISVDTDTRDTNSVRGIIDALVRPYSSSNSDPEADYGFRLRCSTRFTTCKGRVKTGFRFGLDMDTGIDFSGSTFSTGGPAIRLAGGQTIDWNGDNTKRTFWNGTTNRYVFRNGANEHLSVADSTGQNGLLITPAAAGSSVGISPGGNNTETNANLSVRGAGAGLTKLGTAGTSGSGIQFNAAQADISVQNLTPSNGSTVGATNNSGVILLAPAATIASATLNLPTAPQDGGLIRIVCSFDITTLTIVPGAGYTMAGGNTTSTTCGPNGKSKQLWVKANAWHILQ